MVSFVGELRNSASQNTIFLMRVELDGREILTGSSTDPVPRMGINTRNPRLAAPGNHTLSIYIASQTSSPNTYTAGADLLVCTNQQLRRTVPLPERTQSLQSGEAITFSFDL